MKKQILLLTFLSLAILFAGINKVYGQVTPTPLDQGITGTQPIPALSCADGSGAIPLHPFPGVSYTYTMTGDPAAVEQPNQWTWYATKDPNFITTDASGAHILNTANALQVAPGQLLAAGTDYGVPSSSNSIAITWTPEILAATQYLGDATNWASASSSAPTPTFVVGYATGVNCADNIQVYEINPRFNFTIDIANIDPATDAAVAWDQAVTQCVDDVWEAIYNSGTNELDMDYGTNTLYFEVAAANFVDNWSPTFTLLDGLDAEQTAVVTLHSSLNDAQTDANIIATDNWTSATTEWVTGEYFSAATSTEVVTGVSLYVKVVISNLTDEGLDNELISLAVDAIDDSGTGIWDMEEDDCDPTTASDAADQADYADHTITPRPTIIMDGGSMAEPSGIDPENLVPKTVPTP